MACKKCQIEAETGDRVYPFRVGNSEIGYGNVLIVACPDHAELIMERLQEHDAN